MIVKENDVFLKVKMYILSLWLLFCLVIISTINYKELCAIEINWKTVVANNVVPIICLVLLVLCVIFYFQFKNIIFGTTMLSSKVIKVNNRNSDYMAFLVTYIMPLIFVNFMSKRQMLILLLLLIIIGIMYVKTDMFLSNPTLALLGYNIYDIITDNDNIYGIMISRSEIKNSDEIRYIPFGNQAYFIKKV